MRTSSGFIVRELLRPSEPLKAKTRHPASQALAVLAPSVGLSPSCNSILGPRFLAAQVMVHHKGTSTSSGQLSVRLPQVPPGRLQCKFIPSRAAIAARSIPVVGMPMASSGRHAGCALISRLSRGITTFKRNAGHFPARKNLTAALITGNGEETWSREARYRSAQMSENGLSEHRTIQASDAYSARPPRPHQPPNL